MAIDSVVDGMQGGANALLLAESVEGIRRGLAPDHTVEDDPGAGLMWLPGGEGSPFKSAESGLVQ